MEWGNPRYDRISGPGAVWVDYSGPVGGGRRAGVAVTIRPRPSAPTWFVYDWGTVTVNPFFPEGRLLRVRDAFVFEARLFVHDGDLATTEVVRLQREFDEEQGA